jgi:hypothetical protein
MMMSLSVTLGILLVLYEYFLLFMYGLQWRGVPSALQRQVLLELLPGDVGLRGVVDLLLHSLASWGPHRANYGFISLGWVTGVVSDLLQWVVVGGLYFRFDGRGGWVLPSGDGFPVGFDEAFVDFQWVGHVFLLHGKHAVRVGISLLVWFFDWGRNCGRWGLGWEASSDVASLHALWCGLMVDGLVFPWWLGWEDRITRRRLGLWWLGHFTRSCGIVPFYLELWLISFFIWCSALWLRQP